MLKLYKHISCLTCILLSLLAQGQDLPTLGTAPEIQRGSLPDGIQYYLVTQPEQKGHADFALVQRGRRDAAQAQHRRGDYEFSLIRQAYDAVKAEAPQAGYPEFLRLYNSTEWRVGMHEEVLHGLDALAKGDRQFLGEERYRPGLAKFLTQEMWKMKPRAPDGQSGVKTPEDEELERRVQENERKMRQRMAERKKLLG